MTKLLNKETIESIYECAIDILATVGVEFDMSSARELFKKNGAKIDGKRVYLPPSFLTKVLHLMPKYKYEPTNIKKLVAASPFSNSPMMLDDLTSIAPFSITDIEEIWCYPGHMAAFAGGSFNKIIFKELLPIILQKKQ